MNWLSLHNSLEKSKREKNCFRKTFQIKGMCGKRVWIRVHSAPEILWKFLLLQSAGRKLSFLWKFSFLYTGTPGKSWNFIIELDECGRGAGYYSVRSYCTFSIGEAKTFNQKQTAEQACFFKRFSGERWQARVRSLLPLITCKTWKGNACLAV